jgi:RNA polymerase sigma factor for flagellar operon FliA
MLPRSAAVHNPPENCEPEPSAAVASLIEKHLSYAHAIAAEVMMKLPPDLERKDVQGWAELGLVEAAHSFDPSRRVQFTTFAYYRIKGAIYDGLRKMGWYPKGRYRQMRFEMNANEQLRDASSELRQSTSPEAQLQELKSLTSNLMSCYMLSLESLPQEPVCENQISAEEAVIRSQQRSRLRQALTQLPEMNRRVLEYCYFHELTLEQIGQKLGLSRSWVCRIHAKSLEMVRKQLTGAPLPPPAGPPATFPAMLR